MRRLKNLATEMGLQVVAYHLKRVLAILEPDRSSPPYGRECDQHPKGTRLLRLDQTLGVPVGAQSAL